jgi:DNA invertase Pin-like site-specific DNA recombinase
MLIGYARVSREDQKLELQLQALNDAGCDRVFSDKKSGSQKHRKGLEDALSHLRTGDILVVWKLDRLGRTVKQLVDLVEELEGKGINFKSVKDNIDTTTSAGRFFFHLMASLAQMERELIVERTKAGLEAAKKLGRVGGRKRVMTESKIKSAKKLLQSGVVPKDVAEDLGVSVATLYRWIPEAASLAND